MKRKQQSNNSNIGGINFNFLAANTVHTIAHGFCRSPDITLSFRSDGRSFFPILYSSRVAVRYLVIRNGDTRCLLSMFFNILIIFCQNDFAQT